MVHRRHHRDRVGQPDARRQHRQRQAGVALTPIAEGGRLSYRVSSVGLSASIQATGACDLGFDVCDFFGDYKAR